MMDIRKMIPFLEEEELEQLADKILSSESETYQGVTIKNLLPFLDDDYIDHLFYISLVKGLNVDCFFPFISDDVLSKATDDFVKGEIKDFPLNQALPFMDDDDVCKIALKCLDNKDESFLGVSLNQLMPFLDDETIDKIFLDKVKNNGDYLELLPFIDDETLSSIINDYIHGKGNPNLDLDKIYPFLDDEDIKKLFKFELNKNKGR